MKRRLCLLLIMVLPACGRGGGSTDAALPTVDALAADPVRLKALREQCQLDRARLGDALCNRVALATNKRFLGDGKAPYTPTKTPSGF